MLKKLFGKLFSKKETPKNSIIAISTNRKNVIKKVQLDSGEILDVKQAIEMTEQGLIEGVEVISVRNGYKALRAIPDADTSNNLKDLPRF